MQGIGDSVDPQVFNNVFFENLNTATGIEKAAAAGQAYIRSKIREIGFMRRIMPPEMVTRADVTRSTDHDTLVKIVDVEINSKAFPVNFIGTAPDKYFQGNRYAVPFYKIETEKFIKNEAELLAYDYPVTKVIEENSVKDVQKVEDVSFINHAEIAIGVTGKRVVSAATIVDRKQLNQGFKLIDRDELTASILLMNTSDFDDYMIQPATEIGSPLASELTVDGYKYQHIMGRRIIVTNKHDIVRPGEIWFFAEPAYLGNFFILNDLKFWIKKEADLIMWKSWEYIGAGIGNPRAVAKLELDVADFGGGSY